MSILESERVRYREAWQIPNYDDYSPGETVVDAFVEMSGATSGRVLDAGCGSGKGALALAAKGFDVSMCDLTPDGLLPEAAHFPFFDVCLWHDVKAVTGLYEWVYCADVLEHVPTPFTMIVVQRLLEVARRGVFLSICTQHDQAGIWTDHPLHLTVQSFVQWRDQLRELATITECRDRLIGGVYLLEAR